MRNLAPSVFPWADKITVQSSWAYQWWQETDTITLPTTDENTVSGPATAAEEAALTDGVDAQP